jgi:16S rRNA (adenine1518-N6/adenine1519-N6)-dimethyltransferase
MFKHVRAAFRIRGAGKLPLCFYPMKQSPRKKNKNENLKGAEDRRTKWKFGQNFLVDETVVRGICDDVPSSPADWIIEIGPGQGALTRRLALRCKKLTAVEIDPKWVEHLRAHTSWGTLDVIQADAIRVDWEEILDKHAPEPGQKPLVVGNLPYNRAAPILFHLLPHLHRCQSAQIMVQYEVAKRLCGQPHSRDFSFLSVMVQNRASTELLRKVTPEAFRPRPKVWSATVRLTPRSAPASENPAFGSFVHVAFSQKRKLLANALEPFYSKEKVMQTLAGFGVRPDSRAEDLSVEEFAKLFEVLGPLKKELPPELESE